MQKYKVASDFVGTGFIPILKSIVTAIPPFFSIMILAILIAGTGASYFTILKTTGKKRFMQVITGMSFFCFLLSVVIVAMNDTTTTFLSGYWVGFYIVATVGSYILLNRYK